jgi:hypothetical protein
MSYRVFWRERDVHALAVYEFLAREVGRPVNQIPAAVEQIEYALRSNPHTAGESRGDTERVLVVLPLAVFFEAFEDQRVVLIYRFTYRPK